MRHRERRVVEERRGGEEPRLDRQRVEKRLQRRARLAARGNAIHFGARDSSPLDPTQASTSPRRVVEDDQRPVLDVAAVELAQVALQGLDGVALDAGVERARHALARTLRERPREVRRVALDLARVRRAEQPGAATPCACRHACSSRASRTQARRATRAATALGERTSAARSAASTRSSPPRSLADERARGGVHAFDLAAETA